MDESTKEKIREFLRYRVQSCRVLVIGDIMLDRYFYGQVTRISPEAPVPVNLVDEKKDTLGGAANVAHNLAQLGCQTYLVGAIGRDHHGRVLQRKLRQGAIHTEGIIFGREKTTTKIRILGGHQQMIRLDFEETDTIAKDVEEQIKIFVFQQIKNGVDAIIISDYGKGICTSKTCQYIIMQGKKKHIPVFVDPKGTQWGKYKGASYITPNVKEVGIVLNQTLNNGNEALCQAAHRIKKQYSIENVMITRSEKGISLYGADSEINIPTVAQEVFDVSGAGDTVIAVFAAGLGSGLSELVSAEMANFAAGIEVGKLGTYAVSNQDIQNSLG